MAQLNLQINELQCKLSSSTEENVEKQSHIDTLLKQIEETKEYFVNQDQEVSSFQNECNSLRKYITELEERLSLSNDQLGQLNTLKTTNDEMNALIEEYKQRVCIFKIIVLILFQL